jgi:hypothetical protein
VLRFLLPALVLTMALATATAHAAATCGARDARGNVTLGSLTLDDNSSVSKNYRSAKGKHDLVLIYEVQGCLLPRTATTATVVARGLSLLPAKAGADLPKEAVSYAVASVDPSEVEVRVTADLDQMPTGTSGGFVRIRVPAYLADSQTPVAVSRTSNLVWPLVLGFLGGLGGLLWAIGLHVTNATTFRFAGGKSELAVVCALAVAAGLVAGYGYWHNQDVWTRDANAFATLAAAFTASTTGALAGVTATLFGTPAPAPPARI